MKKPGNSNATGKSLEDLQVPLEDKVLLEEIGIVTETPEFRRSRKKTPSK